MGIIAASLLLPNPEPNTKVDHLMHVHLSGTQPLPPASYVVEFCILKITDSHMKIEIFLE